MIPGTKPTRRRNLPLSALQQESLEKSDTDARQTAAQIPHEEKTEELLDRRAAIAAAIPALGDALVKLLRVGNTVHHSIKDEWKKSR